MRISYGPMHNLISKYVMKPRNENSFPFLFELREENPQLLPNVKETSADEDLTAGQLEMLSELNGELDRLYQFMQQRA